MRKGFCSLFYFLLFVSLLPAEQFRTNLKAVMDLRSDKEGAVELGFNDSFLLRVPETPRFIRGIELELNCPQAYLRNKGSLALLIYRAGRLSSLSGIIDVNTERLFIEPVPGRLRNLYQIPLRSEHGFRTSPYVTVPFAYAGPGDYLVRIMPIAKGFEDGIESWRFSARGRIVYGDEGAVRLRVKYPQGMENLPYTLTVDDVSVVPLNGELVLKAGERHLSLRSPHFRTEHRFISLAAGQLLDLELSLRDPAPLVLIQTPQNARVWFNGEEIVPDPEGLVTTPGEHEIRFAIGNYTLTRTITTRLGMTYEVNLLVDVQIQEKD